MIRRSRGGCIDCRKAKVKCDEIRPSCGTCARRRHICQGYVTPPSPAAQTTPKSGQQTRRDSSERVLSQRLYLNDACGIECDGPPVGGSEQVLASPCEHSLADRVSLEKCPFSRFDEPMTMGSSNARIPKAGHPLIMDPSQLLTPRVLGLLPPGVVHPDDEATVEVYFSRHPYELSMGAEFVNEMNANVLLVLQHNPQAIVDSLSAIGHSYLTSSASDSSLTVLNYRARILATLRAMEHSEHNLEDRLALLLALCAMELVDSKTTPLETTIPAIIANSAALINHHVSSGREVSGLARYFIRALARQDIIISLMHLKRTSIPTSVWLDEEAQTSADRLMGYTTTFMPLLEELCSLAEDVRTLLHPEWVQRSDNLGVRIKLWKSGLPHGMPFGRSRRFLSQAACYRAGALLYLFRLLNPPSVGGGSNELWAPPLSAADREATTKAHEVLMATSVAGGDEVKMLLWPVFLAACEMLAEEDRQLVLKVLDAIIVQRRTATAQRTKTFVLNRVWAARDEGREWSWMILAQRYPGECLPI